MNIDSTHITQINPKHRDQWPNPTVAITGMLGSGKSTVTRILAEKKFPVIDCDKLAHTVTEYGSQGFERVVNLFGSEILKPDGTLNRAMILAKILRDQEAHKALEKIVHPLVLEALDTSLMQLAAGGEKTAIVEVPLLFESGWHRLFDLNCMVTAPESVCIARIMARNRVDEETAHQWLKLQMPTEIKIRMADCLIRNDHTLDDLKREVELLYQKLSCYPGTQ